MPNNIDIKVTGDNPEVVEAVSHVVASSLQEAGFHNTAVMSTNTGEPENPNPSLLDLMKQGNPELFNTNIAVTPVFDAPESDAGEALEPAGSDDAVVEAEELQVA
jgi:hypothetical protein